MTKHKFLIVFHDPTSILVCLIQAITMQLELLKVIKDLILSILRTPHQLPSQLETLRCIMTPLAEAVVPLQY